MRRGQTLKRAMIRENRLFKNVPIVAMKGVPPWAQLSRHMNIVDRMNCEGSVNWRLKVYWHAQDQTIRTKM
jgi:hypothetical protein